MSSRVGKKMIEEVKDGEKLLALIIRREFEGEGIEFFTPSDFSQQLGYMKRPRGYEIPPHVHNELARTVTFTKEVLFIKKGRIRVDFYDDSELYLHSRLLDEGDVILLAYGGHGFKILEEAEIFEVKQGPYAGEKDKSRFGSILDSDVVLLDGEEFL